MTLTTAKFLLFIALCLGPKYGDNNHKIEIVNKTSNVVWSQISGGWNISEKSLATDDWPSNGTDVSIADLNHFNRANADLVREISNHDWKHNAILYLPNGDIAEKHGNTVFYTINAGGYNQQVYTILTIENGKPL